ncbi:Ig-like domain-containing protein, partial [Hymenobacter terrenus]|uniref:Ig-like domain-containing protein n=1 Tax=Hymenobacter terrenus TaxID=1629124 RepID=UPI0018CF1570
MTGPIFNVTDYGAIANDGKDDIVAIQKAVDAACRNGGGVVQFPAGTFDFDVNSPVNNPNVRIWASNVVIRGAGNNKATGTVLHDHKANDVRSETEGWTTVKLPNFFSFSSVDMHWEQELWYPNSKYSSTVPLTTFSAAPRLSTVLTVADASKLKVGGTYTITEADPDKSLVREMSPGSPSYGTRPAATGTDYIAMKYRQIVRILAVSGNQITIDNPILMELRSAWSPTLWPTEHPIIREVGLENIYLKMVTPKPFVHHDGAAADYGYNHVRFDWVEDGWMHNVVQEGTTSAVLLRDSKNCTIYDCSIAGGEGHFGYQLAGTPSRNLFLNLWGAKQFHTFAIEGGVGNVFKNCAASDTAAVDLHGSVYGIYNLFDNITGCVGAGGGDSKQVPPNHGTGFTAWNWKMGTTSPYTKKPQDVYVDVTAYFAYNAPGFVAAGVRSKDGHPVYYTDLAKNRQTADLNVNWGYNESNGAAVSPASLYDAQKAVRLNYNWVELTSPGLATLTPKGSTVNIAAAAGAASGKTISSVEFFINGASVGKDNSAPYAISWPASTNGLYTVTAKMTASDNSVTTSDERRISVGSINIVEDKSPLVTYSGGRIQSETNSTSSEGTAVWIADGGMMSYSFHGTRVTTYTNLIGGDGQNWSIYLDNVKVFGRQLPVAVNRPGYKVWDSGELSDGPHTLRCVAEAGGFSFDYLAAVVTTPSTGSAPTAAITSPANNASFAAGATVTINANAVDSDGSISKVEFFQGATKLGEDTTSPFSFSWTNVVGGTYSLVAKATDNSGSTTISSPINIVVAGTSNATLRPADNPTNTVNGLNYGYFEGDWSVLPAFSSLSPAGTGTVTTFDLAPRKRENKFGFQYTGYVDVPTDGEYTFYTSSDDGSKLLIGSTEVVNNDGLHANQEKSGTIGLKAGKHALTATFFQQWGGQQLSVSYAGPGLAKTLIPASALYRVAGPTTPPTTPTGNLALGKPTTTSSTQDTPLGGANAVDGNGSSRWSSAFSNDQWLYVDLGASFSISRVKLVWEGAYGKDYKVQISNDPSLSTGWTDLRSVTGNTALVNELTGLSGTGRYLRVLGITRGTP